MDINLRGCLYEKNCPGSSPANRGPRFAGTVFCSVYMRKICPGKPGQQLITWFCFDFLVRQKEIYTTGKQKRKKKTIEI